MAIHEILLRFHGEIGNQMADKNAFDVEIENNSTPEVAALIEENRFKEMRKRRIKQVRKDRADTGVQRFGKEGLQAVSLEGLIQDLLEAGYVPVDVFAERKPRFHEGKPTKKFKTITTVMFSVEPGAQPCDPEIVADLHKALKGYVAENCHVWRNDYCDTINLTGRVETVRTDLRITGVKQVYQAYPR